MAETKKKFCPDCGKQLVAGQKHECGKEEGLSTQAIADRFKGYCKDFVAMLKKPTTTLKKKMNEGNLADGLIILGVMSIIAGIFMMMAVKPLLAMTIKSTTGLKITDFSKLNLNYFKIFITTTLSAVVFAFIPVVITFIAGKIAKKDDLSFAKSTVLYAYTSMPIIPLYLVFGIIMLTQVSFLITICALIILFIEFVCLINYFKIVADTLSVKEDNRGYAITGILFAWMAVIVVILMIFGRSMYGDMSSASVPSKSATSSSIFKF